MNVYVIEVSPAIDAAGTLQTFLFSSEGWATLPTDTPANTLVQARLDQPGNFRRELFSGNRTTGAVRPSFGECTLINSDGALDEFSSYGFDGHAFKISYGPSGGAYPSEFTTLLKATLRGATFDLKRVHLIIRDRMELLDRPISQTTFAGTGGEEGTTELTGKRKPLAFGEIRSIRPQLLSQTLLLYSVGLPPAGCEAQPKFGTDGQSAGYDTAYHAPSPTSDWYAPSLSALLSASIYPGYWWCYPPLGLFRLGSQPAIDLTCSVSVNLAGTPQSELGTILNHMALSAGVSDIDAADVAAINVAKPSIFSYHVDSEETALAAMSNMASSASCWFGMGADDVLHMGTFDAPSGTPSIELRSHDIIALEKLDGGDVNRLIPVWRVTAQCSHNNAPQTNFAGSCPEWWRVWCREEWPGKVVSEDPSIKNKHPYADEMSIDVYGGAQPGNPNTDGGAAAAAMALYGVDRELVRVDMPLQPSKFTLMEIGAVVSLKFPRYQWGAGKLFRIVAIDANFGRNQVSLTLWG